MWDQFLTFFTVDNSLFFALSFVGMFSHALKKYMQGQLSGSIFDYVFKNNKKRTIIAILTNIGAIGTLILANQVPTEIGAFIVLAMTTGYTSDSTANSDNAA